VAVPVTTPPLLTTSVSIAVPTLLHVRNYRSPTLMTPIPGHGFGGAVFKMTISSACRFGKTRLEASSRLSTTARSWAHIRYRSCMVDRLSTCDYWATVFVAITGRGVILYVRSAALG
jgi:hypothetical protein